MDAPREVALAHRHIGPADLVLMAARPMRHSVPEWTRPNHAHINAHELAACWSAHLRKTREMVCMAAPPGEAAMASAHWRAADTSQAYMSERCSRSASSALSTSSSSLPVGKMITGHHRLLRAGTNRV